MTSKINFPINVINQYEDNEDKQSGKYAVKNYLEEPNPKKIITKKRLADIEDKNIINKRTKEVWEE